MDLIGAIITWVIGLPVALILGCFLGVGVFLLHRKCSVNQVVRERILWVSFAVALVCLAGVVWVLGPKWLLMAAFFGVPLFVGNVMGVRTSGMIGRETE